MVLLHGRGPAGDVAVGSFRPAYYGGPVDAPCRGHPPRRQAALPIAASSLSLLVLLFLLLSPGDLDPIRHFYAGGRLSPKGHGPASPMPGASTLPTFRTPSAPPPAPRRPLQAAATPLSLVPVVAVEPSPSGANSPLNPKSSKAWEVFRSMGSPRVWLAPMVDASELPFRLLCRRYGVDAAYTPMLHSRLFVTASARYRSETFTTCAADRPLLAQFCANDPAYFVAAAKWVQGNVSGVDLNLGCPQRIARTGRYGAFLMDDVPLVESIVRAAARNLRVPVTVKIRVFPDVERTLDYARRLRDAGASIIAVHGRTIDQKSPERTRANWDIIRQVVAAVPDVPVIANGNIRDRRDLEECLRYTGAAAAMSAQSLLDNPTALAPADHPILKVPDRLPRVMLEYLDLVEGHPVPLRMVHGHVHSALSGWLAEFPDVREDLNRIPRTLRRNATLPVALPLYRAVVTELRHRILRVHELEGRSDPLPQAAPPAPPGPTSRFSDLTVGL